MCFNIEENAIFIADAHFNEQRGEFFKILEKLKTKEITTTQLFLMGDMFDFITQESYYFIKQNQKVIDLLNELSCGMQIVYLEGNHDYNLEKLFPNITIISRDNQPIRGLYKTQKVALSHGDNFDKFSYNLYCKIIRNRPLLRFLNAIDFNHWLSKKIDAFLKVKNICHLFNNFEELAQRRVKNYQEDIVIEGHFHQGKEYLCGNQLYVNIPSLFCSKEYVQLNNGTFNTIKF
ncbi:MAG: UDP-2,3-diacylglucosamine diphosphatase [Candidatus Marinarcus sp.]|uniref:UDP-2,3-diacylglucosamine diphosphatase n=1 Tax=Candidatus Marinarcus sp. TaxID=3100987 RepID=UPI003B004C52